MKPLIFIVLAVLGMALTSCESRSGKAIKERSATKLDTIYYRAKSLETGNIQLVKYVQPSNLISLVYLPTDQVWVDSLNTIDNETKYSTLHVLLSRIESKDQNPH